MNDGEFNILWCQRLFTMLDLGGIWGVPRSGLIFRKESIDPPTLLLVEMPNDDFSREDLREIKKHFALAGITVETEEVAA